MTPDELFDVADRAVFEYRGKHIKDLSKKIFLGSCQGLTYEQLAEQLHRASGGISGEGAELWDLLSRALGEDVSKANFQAALERRRDEPQPQPMRGTSQPQVLKEPAPLDFGFYVERPRIESVCYQEIKKPGALLRIRAPQQMGKTWLMRQVLKYASEQGYETLTLSFEEADSTVFTDLERFLRWFCSAIGKKLGLTEELNSYWNNELAYNYNTGIYFQDYLLAKNTRPLVLALTKVDLVFEHYSEIAIDFCKLLRSWHDYARRDEPYSEIWQKLRLVIVHATDVYSWLDINSSPLAGVGVVVDLPEFTSKQVHEWVQRRGLTWDDAEVSKLMNLVGGHPYLVSLALAEVERRGVTLDDLLQTAHTEAGIYSNHLREHLAKLEQNAELKKAFREVVMSDKLVKLKSLHNFKLLSMGLIKLEGDYAKPFCDLYRKYFQNRLDS